MNLIQKTVIAFLFLSSNVIISQETLFYNNEPGTVSYLNGNPQLKVADGNSTIATSYTNTACGLGYTQASVFLSQRAFPFGPGVVQPAPLVISNLPPAMCTNIVKAFLYVSVSGNGVPITATLTNPQNVTNSFSMSIIGQGVNVCWNYPATYSYRADVTSIVTGNGTYSLSGIPVVPTPSNDAQGATLFVIYSDPTQNYSGSIVMADGAGANNTGVETTTITGFNVCANPSTTENFMLVTDLQKIANAQISLNSIGSNYTLPIANQIAHNFISAPGAPATSGQN